MTHTSALTVLSEALGMAQSEIPPDARIGSLEQWDSLGHARILLALEEKLKRQLSATEAATIESLSDIENLLTKHR